MKRERIVPDYPNILQNEHVVIYYDYDKLVAKGFAGKSSKPVFHLKYQNTEQLRKSVIARFESLTKIYREAEERKNKQKIAQSNLSAADHFKVGDIVVNSWGCEQTNIEFYQVIAVKNKTITVRELLKDYKETGFLCGESTPIINSFVENEKPFNLRLKVRLKADGLSEVIICNPKSFYYFQKWDGHPEYESHYA